MKAILNLTVFPHDYSLITDSLRHRDLVNRFLGEGPESRECRLEFMHLFGFDASYNSNREHSGVLMRRNDFNMTVEFSQKIDNIFEYNPRQILELERKTRELQQMRQELAVANQKYQELLAAIGNVTVVHAPAPVVAAANQPQAYTGDAPTLPPR